MPGDEPKAPETWRQETRAMRLMTALLRKHGPLSRFIASRRVPGPAWRSWDVIAHELYGITEESVSREGLIKWTERYGIPMDTKRTDGETLRTRYLAELAARSIEVDPKV